MQVEFTTDTEMISEEIEVLTAMRQAVGRGHLEVGRDDEGRLVFRMSARGRAYVESMGGGAVPRGDHG